MKKNNRKKKKSTGKIILVLALLAVAGLCVFMYMRRRNAENGKTKFKTAVVERGMVMATVSGSGAVQAYTSVDVKSNVGGTIVSLAVDEGDEVHEGQLIAKIDPQDAQTALEQQQAGLDSANARVGQARESLAMQKAQSQASVDSAANALAAARTRLAQAEESLDAQPELTKTAITQAEASFTLADKDLARLKGLYEKGYVARSDLDTAQQKYDVAKAQLNAAKANAVQLEIKKMDVDAARAAVKQSEASYKSAQAGLTQVAIKQKDVVTAMAQTVSSRAGVANAKNQLGYTTIVAPRDGVVVKKYVEVGSIVTGGRSSISGTGAGVSIVQIADVTRMQVLVDVDETDIGKITEDMPVKVVLDAYPDDTFRGRVAKIAPQAQVTQNVTTVPVTVDIMMADKRLKPGLNATCDFIVGRKRDVLFVPSEAVKDGMPAYMAGGDNGGPGGRSGGNWRGGNSGSNGAGRGGNATATGSGGESRTRGGGGGQSWGDTGAGGQRGGGAGGGRGGWGGKDKSAGAAKEQVVMVLQKGKENPEARKVQIGLEGDENTEIISGLKEGDVVITGVEAPPDASGGSGQSGGSQGSGSGRQGGGSSGRRGGMRGPHVF